MERAKARIRPQVSSGVAACEPPVPHTVMPNRAAAWRSMDVLAIPVVISRRNRGSRSSTVAGKAVRSRMATMTSNAVSRWTRAASSAMWSANTVTSARLVTGDQSALDRATPW